jgi:hypothetical protein
MADVSAAHGITPIIRPDMASPMPKALVYLVLEGSTM